MSEILINSNTNGGIIDASATSLVIESNNANSVIIESVLVESAFTGTLQAKTRNGGAWINIPCVQSDNGVYNAKAAGSTITLTTGDVLLVACAGFYAIRLLRASGAVTVTAIATPADLSALFMAAGANSVSSSGKTLKTVSGSLTSDTDVIAAVTGMKLKIHAINLYTFGTSASTILFKSNGTAGTEVWRVCMQSIASNVMGVVLASSYPSYIFSTVAGEKLTIDVGNADTIHYSIAYWDSDNA